MNLEYFKKIVNKSLTNEDAEAIKNLPNVLDVTGYSNGTGELVYGSKYLSISYSGVNSSYTFVENHDLETGRFFSESDVTSMKKFFLTIVIIFFYPVLKRINCTLFPIAILKNSKNNKSIT